jgi:hypothetical protein
MQGVGAVSTTTEAGELGAINGISLRVKGYFLIIYYFSSIIHNA